MGKAYYSICRCITTDIVEFIINLRFYPCLFNIQLPFHYRRIKDIKDYSQAVKYYDKQLGLCLKLDKVWIYECKWKRQNLNIHLSIQA